jgi:hypothetical protein
MSQDLKKLAIRFVGPTTSSALIQAEGLVNNHYPSCLCAKCYEISEVTENPPDRCNRSGGFRASGVTAKRMMLIRQRTRRASQVESNAELRCTSLDLSTSDGNIPRR